jgi:hypothetical protein
VNVASEERAKPLAALFNKLLYTRTQALPLFFGARPLASPTPRGIDVEDIYGSTS